MFKSKYLRKKIIEIDKQHEIEMREWWNKILPKEGSVLRHLVDIELAKSKNC